MNSDLYYMKRALSLAERGRNLTSPNPRVGCILVKNSKIVGEGWHKAFGSPHAEAEAVADAGSAARGSSAYVTLEPCTHYGKTPPCAELLVRSGIKRVVYSVKDPSLKEDSSDFLLKNSVEVTGGVLKEEGEYLLAGFLKYLRVKKPLVTIKIASSLDGKIASYSGKSNWISSVASREKTMRMRGDYDAILVGAGTVNADDPLLTYRLDAPPARDPLRVILDGRLSVNEEARIIAENTLIFTSEKSSPEKISRIRDKGAEVVQMYANGGQLSINDILEELSKRGVLSLLAEGGSETIWNIISSGEADRFYSVIAPIIIGGNKAPGVCGGSGFSEPALGVQLRKTKVTECGGDIHISCDIID